MCSTDWQKEDVFEQDKYKSYITEHYVFHYAPGSLAEKEIRQIAETQEAAFSRICTALQLNYPERINYYFTDSPLDIGRVFWEEGTSCNGMALCGENKIYAVYSDDIKCIGPHEDTHLISFLLGCPESDFLVEGLAMFFHGLWWGIPNEVWASYHKAKHTALSVSSLLDNGSFSEVSCAITYPVAGAFTAFLIHTYGMDKYLELYRYDGCVYEEIIYSVYCISLSELERSFWAQMRKVSFDASILEDMLRKEGY